MGDDDSDMCVGLEREAVDLLTREVLPVPADIDDSTEESARLAMEQLLRRQRSRMPLNITITTSQQNKGLFACYYNPEQLKHQRKHAAQILRQSCLLTSTTAKAMQKQSTLWWLLRWG